MTDATAASRHAADLEALRAQTDLLLATADGLDDAALRHPSLCAGWTRAHVLSHLTGNARAMLNLVATCEGTPTPMYPSPEARADAIEEGARQGRDALLADVRDSARALHQALAAMPADALDATATTGGGQELPGTHLPGHRLREVVWHHADLDAGYDFHDAPADLVARWFDETVAELRADSRTPAMTLRTTERDVVAIGDGRPTVSADRAGMLRWLVRERPDQIDAPAADRLPDLTTQEDTP